MTDTENLEAVIWRLLRDYKVTVDDPAGLVAALISAAEQFAAGDGPDVTALRRDVLLHDGWTWP